MKRDELTRMFVLDAIADDYENLEKINGEVKSFYGNCGLTIQPSEILGALIDLIELGLARAYWLWQHPPREIEGVPPLDEIDNYYFWLTEEGRKVHDAVDDRWPFDKEGALRRDWMLPEEVEPGDNNPTAGVGHEKSSGNVFADVGLPEDFLAKAELVAEIARAVSDGRMNQTELAAILGIDQPRVSALLRGKLNMFSLSRLIQLVARLGNAVEIATPSITVNRSKQPATGVPAQRSTLRRP
jgi:predicted XRE-type DNA-binding protein